MQEERDKNPK